MNEPTIITYHQSTYQNSKPNRKRRRTSVQFAVNNSVDRCESSMSDDERSSIWYRQEELDSFRSDARSASLSSTFMQLLVKESQTKSIKIDEKEILHQRRRKRHVAIKAVLEAQRRLKTLPLGKDEKLADVSCHFSNWARNIAHRVAIVDSYEACLCFDSQPRKRPCPFAC